LTDPARAQGTNIKLSITTSNTCSTVSQADASSQLFGQQNFYQCD